MKNSTARSRMIENEAIFRQYNEQVKRGFDEVKNVAAETGHEHLAGDFDGKLHFYCECADENCHKRVLLSPRDYNEIHKNRRRFVLVPGHDTNEIERVVARKTEYDVVEKFEQPPETVGTLSRTELNNV
jgi:hypothetical protein